MNKKEQKSIQTKQKLQDAFLALYTGRNIDKISIREITDMAGYNRATFYIHYTDVYHLRDTIEETLLRTLDTKAEEIFSPMGDYDIAPLATTIFSLYHNYGDTFFILLTHPNSSFSNKVKHLMRTKFLKRCPGLSSEDTLKVSLIMEYQISAVIGVIAYWQKTKDIPFEDLLTALREISSSGVLHTIADVLQKYLPHE